MKQTLFSLFVFLILSIFPLKAQEAKNVNIGEPINLYTLQEEEIRLYPNPASSTVNIELKNNMLIKRVTIYSILGNTIMDKPIPSKNKIELNIANIKKGKYLIKIFLNDNSVQVKSLIKN